MRISTRQLIIDPGGNSVAGRAAVLSSPALTGFYCLIRMSCSDRRALAALSSVAPVRGRGVRRAARSFSFFASRSKWLSDPGWSKLKPVCACIFCIMADGDTLPSYTLERRVLGCRGSMNTCRHMPNTSRGTALAQSTIFVAEPELSLG